MKRPAAPAPALSKASAFLLATACTLAAVPSSFGQAAPTASPEAKPSSPAPAAGATAAATDDVVVMDPFVVTGEEDAGYSAKATLAGTRIRTELKDVGASISVVTSKFLQDTGSKNAEQLLVYTTNTEVAGQGGNFVGQGDGAVLTATNRTSPIQNTRVRGLTEADNTRDFFLSDIPWDSYNVGRVDLQRGPNSILFGIGSPAGIVNSSLNTASFKNANKLENVIDNYGTLRFSGDFNRVLIPNELALRLSLLRDETKYRQDPAFKDDKRVFGALKWDPAALKTDSGRTSLRANFETGKINANYPRSTPPLDAITPWYTQMSKATFDAKTSNDAAQTNFWLGAPGGRVFDGVITTFTGGAQGFSYPSKVQPWPDTSISVPGSLVGNNGLKGINTYDAYARAANLPHSGIAPYKAKSLTDASIFDFYDNLIEGPNKREHNRFNAFNVAGSQTILNDKAGVELAYDHQDAKWGYENFLSGDATIVTVDIMKTLLDGSPNPNVGRPMTIAGGGSAGGYFAKQTREVLRATAYGEINFNDISGKDSALARLFGRNTVTGLLTRQENDFESRTYNRYYLDDAYAPNKNQGSVGQASRDDIIYSYLGNSVAGLSTASGIGLTGIKDKVAPQNSTIVTWNNLTNAWQTIPLIIHNNDVASEQEKTYRLARKNKDVVDSKAIVWQGYWLDNALIPMFGWRKDTQKFRDAGNPPGAGGLVNPYDPSWKLPDTVTPVSGVSKTYSLVARLPKSVTQKLPGGFELSAFYNQSENFKPDSGRRDIVGNPVDNPKGKTKEYGVMVTAFDERLAFKVAKYKTNVANATIGNEIGGQYLIGANEAWGQRAAYKFKNEPGTWPADTIFGYSTSGKAVTWRPAGPQKGTAGAFTYTQAELDATWARELASINDWFAKQVPANFQTAWALTNYDKPTYGGDTNYGASGLVVTGDTASSGLEFEIVANPIKGLDVSFNASKTSAKRTNLASSYVSWITKRWADLQGPMGDMRLWGADDDSSVGNTHTGETARGKFSRETMAGYNLFLALQDSDVPELRPWRFNTVVNYTFQSDGALKGANVGASYRWQEASVTGFPIKTVAGVDSFDVTKPYKGKSEGVTDLWIGYGHKLTDRIDWRIQLNVRNVFATDKLLPVTVQPDGSAGAYRIAEPRTISLTNTLSF